VTVTAKRARILLQAGVIVTLSIALLSIAPAAQADSLTDKKNATQTKIDQNKAQTSRDQTALNKAAAALLKTQQDLVTAQADLVDKQQATQDAQAEDTRLAGVAAQAQRTLTTRQTQLQTAQQAVADGEANIEKQRQQTGLVVQMTAQQNTTLLSLSIILSNFDVAQMNNRMQWASTVLDASQNAMDQLLQAQTQLQQAQDKAQLAEQAATDAHTKAQQASQAASAHLVSTQTAAATARQAQTTVTALLDANKKAQATAKAVVQADKAKQTQLKQQLAQIEQQIKDAEEAAKHVDNPPAPAPTPSGSGATPSQAKAIALSLLPNYGFSSSQYSCLVNLWNYESGWRYNALNRSSGAYGIPQSLPASKMASVGSDWRTNATTQIKWGLGYIKSRYGSPCGAWSHEQSHSWY